MINWRDKQTRAYLCAGATMCLWGTSASAFKVALGHMDHWCLLLWSLLVSIVALGGYLLVTGRLAELKPRGPRDIAWSVGLGFLNPFLYYVVVLKAYELLPAQEAQPLNFVWPIVLALLSVPLLGQKLRPASMLAFAFGFVGVLVISTGGDVLGFRFTDPLGASLAVGSSVVWALFWIYNVRDDRDEVVKLFLNFVFALPLALTCALIWGDIGRIDLVGSLAAVWVGLFELGITFVLWLKALQLSESTARVGVFIYGVPFLSLICIHFVVGEDILPATLIGLVCIVTGIVVQKRWG